MGHGLTLAFSLGLAPFLVGGASGCVSGNAIGDSRTPYGIEAEDGAFEGAANEPPPDAFVVREPGLAVTARLESARLEGPDTSLVHDGNAFRGRAKGDLVDLAVSENGTRIRGLARGGRVDLHVDDHDGRLDVRGIYAGVLTEFTLGPTSIRGTVGRCAYDAERRNGERWYGGGRICTSTDANGAATLPRPVRNRAIRVAFPAGFFDRDASQRVAFAVIVLGE
ncbi:MAG: hypothetical protein U0169_09545 [Polyangiaceae bacterium]